MSEIAKSEIAKSFHNLVELVQEFGGGRNPITGQELKTPKIEDDLNPPASSTAILDLEKVLGFTLSADLRQLLTLHDGQVGNGPPAFGLYSFLPINQMLEIYQTHKGFPAGEKQKSKLQDDRLQPVWWHPGWLPVGEWEQSELTVDLSPTNAGTAGQVFLLNNNWTDPWIVAPSLNDFLLITLEKTTKDPSFSYEYESYIQ